MGQSDIRCWGESRVNLLGLLQGALFIPSQISNLKSQISIGKEYLREFI
jgi:hypothetical protein